MGRRSVGDTAEEVLALVKSRNYVRSSVDKEYRTGLLREQAAFRHRGKQELELDRSSIKRRGP